MTKASDLRQRLRDLRAEQPGVRARDAAQALGVSEAELVASGVEETATCLTTAWRDMLGAMPTLGRVMCLTRNDHCVHERHGRFEQVSANGPHGLVLGPDIDLRIFFGQWHAGFAVAEETRSFPRRSLQFFDAHGTAVHKIYATAETDMAAFDALIAQFRAAAQSAELAVTARPAPTADRPDADIDRESLRGAWRGMRDTHEFFGILQKHKVGRVQALRLAGDDLAQALPTDSVRAVLNASAASETPIMVFVGSPGCIQIHTGPVQKLVPTGPWFNVLDPTFNLHLREDAIAHTFIVRKPTDDGVVTSVEAFDAAGRTIALFFGARKPGQPERGAWRDIAEARAAA
ncbi:hemin-degrading factor [Vineibacter terrae]|uniref:hemin-degrading factor n=1 Tax=Vineibacter terrae TaxID=2586908 RepID=UPI002E2F7B39|nr:ChuX/HutX family heme-like substrate-binding protein [Vineibacter terrae]HEX2890900.1 ChuX/HutX family heme-like substrate-binding protein [Vineibacter terrae]